MASARFGDRPPGLEASRSEVIAGSAMAATSQPLATQIALQILRDGGSAVDAAIAANAALGLMEPTGCGVGGDLFAMVWDAEREVLLGLNASGRSPAALGPGHFRDQGLDAIPITGPLSVSVPGAVDGWFELHARFGKLPMSTLLAPAVRYAREGFPVSEVIAHQWRHNARALQDFAGFADTFMPTGRTPLKGQRFRNPRLAATYETLASDGREAFYHGSIAEAIASYVQANGGFLSVADLAAHRSQWVAPIASRYRDVELYELPPNGQGIAALQILNILEDFDIAAMGFGSSDYCHVLVEAKKLAFEDRARYYADPDFSAVPVDTLVSKPYAAVRRRLLDPQLAATQVPAGDLALQRGDTVCLSVADSAGNMVSLIQSNYYGMGSGMTPGELGFVLQNRGALFALDPAHANCLAPGKRPFHTIIPAFVFRDGRPWISFGLMGGSMQPQGHAQVIVNLIDFGMNLQQAGDAPRVRHDGSSEPTGSRMSDGGIVCLESGFDASLDDALAARGHRVRRGGGDFGGYQAIMVDHAESVYYGASEQRKDGLAAGY